MALRPEAQSRLLATGRRAKARPATAGEDGVAGHPLPQVGEGWNLKEKIPIAQMPKPPSPPKDAEKYGHKRVALTPAVSLS